MLFAVESYSEYGALSGRSIDDMIAGARVEVAPYKRNPMDFVLWKPSGEELPGWDSPWGRGRPGWHIECSAMAYELLGASFDIHAGGIDLQFPHHENEIAQSACAHPEGGFASVWMHNEMLQVEGKKMSKSLGNFFTVRDLLEQGVPGEVIRFVMLSTHYRKPMDWTERKREEAEATLRKWYVVADTAAENAEPSAAFISALSNDLNTPMAISALQEMFSKSRYEELRASLQFLSLMNQTIPVWAPRLEEAYEGITCFYRLHESETVRTRVRDLALEWKELRQRKQWSEADLLKSQLASSGIYLSAGAVEVNADATDVDPVKLEALK